MLSTHGGFARTMVSRSRWGITPGTGKSDCSSRRRRAELKRLDAVPFAGDCTDPCDGRTQGTPGMFDSLPYRNDASIVFGRLIRSLPRARGVLGVATCDKGLPAMMMALAERAICRRSGSRRGHAVGRRWRGRGESADLGARFSRSNSLEDAREVVPRVRVAGRRLPVPGNGGNVAGGRRGPGDVAPACGTGASGHPIWRISREAVGTRHHVAGIRKDLHGATSSPTPVQNAMVAHAAFGGSTNLICTSRHRLSRRPEAPHRPRLGALK